jgi:hypothetical protein
MISRRSMLMALGIGAGSLFLPSLRRGRGQAHADPAAPPQRLIVVGTGHGTVHENWNMRPPGLIGPDVADWDFPLTTPDLAFSRILAPYARLASKMLVLENLAQYSSMAAGGNGHYTGNVGAFTATMPRDLGAGVIMASGPSIDQIVAKQIARTDRLPSLELGNVRSGGMFDDDGIALPVEGSPSSLFQRLFGEPVGATTEGSVLDLVASQYEGLASQLGNDDRQKLAQHQQLIRDLEKRIASLATLHCQVPAVPTDPDYGQPSGVYKSWFEAFSGLIVAAFSCDITRVVSLQLAGPWPSDIDAPSSADIHTDYAHHADDCPDQTADGLEVMTRYHLYNEMLVAGLAMALDAVPEGAGTMLDNTLILRGGELGSGGHSYARLPTVMIGNVGGRFRTGRYVHCGQRFAMDNGGRDNRQLIGPPHAQLLTAIAQAFGVNTNLVGVPTATLQGRAIDLSGALEGLS